MRRNLKRYSGAGDLHFITCSCYRRQPLLASPHRRDMFLRVLERTRALPVCRRRLRDYARARALADQRTARKQPIDRNAGA